MPEVTIRPAAAGDAPVLTRIAHAAKRHWGYPEAWIRLWRDTLTVTPELVRQHATCCATIGGSLVGFYALSREGAVCELEHMWIDPAYMGTGIGRLLFEHAVRTVRASGGTTLRIASDPHAEGFYRRLGARRTGEVPSTPEGRMLPVLEVELDGDPPAVENAS